MSTTVGCGDLVSSSSYRVLVLLIVVEDDRLVVGLCSVLACPHML
jgi:hypothetical protein